MKISKVTSLNRLPLIVFLMLISCKQVNESPDCVLSKLESTMAYRDYLKQYDNKKGDYQKELDNFYSQEQSLTTILSQTENERHIWLIIEENQKQDSILLYYDDNVEYLIRVESEFDLEKCQINQITTYDLNGIESKSKIYQL